MKMFMLKAVVCMAGLSFPGLAAAHHSYAMFDKTKDVVLTGTVQSWQWTNPHAWLVLTVTDANGKEVEFGLEGQSPQVMRGRGWSRAIVKVGDKISVHIAPLKDGSNGGQIYSIIAADGHHFN